MSQFQPLAGYFTGAFPERRITSMSWVPNVSRKIGIYRLNCIEHMERIGVEVIPKILDVHNGGRMHNWETKDVSETPATS